MVTATPNQIVQVVFLQSVGGAGLMVGFVLMQGTLLNAMVSTL